MIARLAKFSVPALTLWSLFVWGNRLRNILAEDGVSFDFGWSVSDIRDSIDSNLSFGITVLFLFVALWVFRSAYGLWRDGAADPLTCVSGAALALALSNVVVWPIRAYLIVGGEWSNGFKAVHTVLALVSVVLGLLVLFHRYGRAGNSHPVRNRQSVADPV